VCRINDCCFWGFQFDSSYFLNSYEKLNMAIAHLGANSVENQTADSVLYVFYSLLHDPNSLLSISRAVRRCDAVGSLRCFIGQSSISPTRIVFAPFFMVKRT
jgi:hypothetical protein